MGAEVIWPSSWIAREAGVIRCCGGSTRVSESVPDGAPGNYPTDREWPNRRQSVERLWFPPEKQRIFMLWAIEAPCGGASLGRLMKRFPCSVFVMVLIF